MTWLGLPICLACHRRLHGPGTGPVGPIPSLTILWSARSAPMCELCGVHASPAALERLWRDEEPLPAEAAP